MKISGGLRLSAVKAEENEEAAGVIGNGVAALEA